MAALLSRTIVAEQLVLWPQDDGISAFAASQASLTSRSGLEDD